MATWRHGGSVQCAQGSGDEDWLIWDNAANGGRGAGLSEQAAHRLAADLELQYDLSGLRSPDHVRRVDPLAPVEKAWQPAGFLDTWIFERGIGGLPQASAERRAEAEQQMKTATPEAH